MASAAATTFHRDPSTGAEMLALLLPDVPTMKEAGVPGIDWTGWWAVFAPAGTPPAIVQRLSNDMQAVMALPEMAASDKLGIETAPMPAAEFSSFFRKSVADHEAVAREFKLTLE